MLHQVPISSPHVKWYPSCVTLPHTTCDAAETQLLWRLHGFAPRVTHLVILTTVVWSILVFRLCLSFQILMFLCFQFQSQWLFR